MNKIDRKREAEIGQKMLQPTPETISVDSSTAQAGDAAAKAASGEEADPQVMSALGSDLVCLGAFARGPDGVDDGANVWNLSKRFVRRSVWQKSQNGHTTWVLPE